MTDEYGMTKFNAEFFKKAGKFVAIAFVIGILVTLYYNNRWKLWMDVRYVGSYGNGKDRYYEYEITNTTKRTLKEVTVTFKVDNAGYGFKDFTFDDTINVFGTMKAGETAVVDVSWNRVKAEAAEHGTELLMVDVEIEKITYR